MTLVLSPFPVLFKHPCVLAAQIKAQFLLRKQSQMDYIHLHGI